MANSTYIGQINDTSSLATNLETIYHLIKKNWDELSLNRKATRIPNSIGVNGINHFHVGFDWQDADNDSPGHNGQEKWWRQCYKKVRFG